MNSGSFFVHNGDIHAQTSPSSGCFHIVRSSAGIHAHREAWGYTVTRENAKIGGSLISALVEPFNLQTVFAFGSLEIGFWT